MVRTRPSSPQDFSYREPRRNGQLEGGDGIILPSIEGNDNLPISPRERRNPFDRLSEPRDLDTHFRERQTVREPPLADFPSHAAHAYQRRRVEDLDRGQPLPEYRNFREASPIRHAEPFYRSRGQPDPVRTGTRLLEYNEPRSSPRLLSQKYPDVRESGFYPQHTVHDHGFGQPAHSATRLRDGEAENHIPQYASRTYEALPEYRAYDNRAAMEHNRSIVPRENAQPAVQDSYARHAYPPGTVVREPLEAFPRQRVVEYEYHPTANRSHILSSHH